MIHILFFIEYGEYCVKRIVICCDGTWNTADAKNPTNVVKFARALNLRDKAGIDQIIYYDDGVGNDKTALSQKFDRLLSGGFGWGLMNKVESAYRFLAQNYVPGDEIYMIGFSRGAYSARSLVGMIRKCGLPPHYSGHVAGEAIDFYRQHGPETAPKAEVSLKFRADFSPGFYMGQKELDWRRANVRNFDEKSCNPLSIKYVGVWDTVGALGLPNHFFISGLFNKKYQFHDTDLTKIVESGRHAVAIDEYRQSYEPSLWANLDKLNEARGFVPESLDAPYQELWFPGDHSSIGSGADVNGISNITLLWVVEGAQKLGLEFNEVALGRIRPEIDHRAPLVSHLKQDWLAAVMTEKARSGPESIARVSESAKERWNTPAENLPEKKPYRPETLSGVADKMPGPDHP